MRLSYSSRKSIRRTSSLINIHDIRVASPCSMPWQAMTGSDQVRHCAECQLNVYNLSAMTEKEIQRLIAERAEQGLCVRFYRRADGTMLTKDCPQGLKRLTKRVSRLGAAILSALVSMNYAIAKTKAQPQACQRVQTSEASANLVVVITDPDGAVVPGARLVLIDKSGKMKFKGRTDGAGALMKNDLPSGDYTLNVAVPGFRDYSDTLHVEHNKNVHVNLKLALAATSTSVEVIASPMVIQGTTQGILSSTPAPTLPPMRAGRSQPAPMRQ